MHEVIQRVLETEAEAKRLVEAAKAEAEGMLRKAREEARETSVRARQTARVESEKFLQLSTLQAASEREENLARGREKVRTRSGLDSSVIQSLVEGVVRCVCLEPEPARELHR
jgi:vacuolar-type H+-ATPase subunit H